MPSDWRYWFARAHIAWARRHAPWLLVTKSRKPDVIEYDVMMAHPQAVELVAQIQDELPEERHLRIAV